MCKLLSCLYFKIVIHVIRIIKYDSTMVFLIVYVVDGGPEGGEEEGECYPYLHFPFLIMTDICTYSNHAYHMHA